MVLGLLAMSLIAAGSRPVVYARHGMVATSQPLAVECGLEALRAGGTAVDAAIATNACLGVTEPTSCGLGGDLFAIVWEPGKKRPAGLDASGRAPLALTAEKVTPTPRGTIPTDAPASWTVPGAADGWFELHGRFGKLPMARVLAPAIRHAEEGFPVSPVIARYWARGARKNASSPGFREVFMPAPREGQIFKNPALARTLRLLAERGRDAFYKGPIAAAIVDFSRRNGGFFAAEDFARHRSDWVEPVSTSYRGHDVWELPPPGQGLSALQILNILEPHDLRSLGRASADFWHLLVEAKKLAYADRARYFAEGVVPVAALLSKEYARRRGLLIDMQRAAAVDPPGDPEQLARPETAYLAAADDRGQMVSLIQSNYTGFGSGHAVPELGFGLQSRGACFALRAGHRNRLAPGKRPFHTIIPAFLSRAGTPLMAFGVMGGDMQPQGHVQVLVNLLDLGMGLQEAGDAARFHHTGSSDPDGTAMSQGGVLHLEDAVPAGVADELLRRGHRIERTDPAAYGGYQAIWRDPETGVYRGATESRKDGFAAGY